MSEQAVEYEPWRVQVRQRMLSLDEVNGPPEEDEGWKDVASFVHRPTVTVGDGWMRMQAVDQDRWLEIEFEEVRIVPDSRFALMAALTAHPVEELTEQARIVRDSGYRAAAEVLDQAINLRLTLDQINVKTAEPQEVAS